MNMLRKILTLPKTLVDEDCFAVSEAISTSQRPLAQAGNIFNGSLAIRVVTAGSTNACEQELVALANPYYDVERFGIHFVASPRHADVLLVTGPVTRNMRAALIKTYEAIPAPKIVVALGDDAIDGGLFRGSYAVLDGVKSVIPVDYEIPGDPPSPGQIISALLQIAGNRQAKQSINT